MQSLIHTIGKIFQPLLDAVGATLAFFYSIIPNYPIDVALLTIVIMVLLTPLTVKSTKNMAAMQALAPEMKKLQQKYKGAENRAQLNEEMMKLYKEHNVNPASGCLPMLLQMPAFFVLYSVIRGMTNTVSHQATTTVNGVVHHSTVVVAEPRYIPVHTKMYEDIVAAHGQLNSFGMNFADKLLSHHSSIWAAIPFLVLVAGAVGLQYLQMARLNSRNPGAAQANPQAAMLQKYMPLIFGFIYINVAAILNVYFIVSSAIRIITQEILFRKGIGVPQAPPVRSDGGGAKKPPVADRTERELPRAKTGARPGGARSGPKGTPNPKGTPKGTGSEKDSGNRRPTPTKPGARSTIASPKGRKPAGPNGSGSRAVPGENGRGATRSGAGSVNGGQGRAGAPRRPGGDGSGDESGGNGAAKPHPRSKSKRERKAR